MPGIAGLPRCDPADGHDVGHSAYANERVTNMLQSDTLAVFARLDTSRQVSILTQSQTLDTPEGDAVLGHLAGNHPDEYRALVIALARGGNA